MVGTSLGGADGFLIHLSPSSLQSPPPPPPPPIPRERKVPIRALLSCLGFQRALARSGKTRVLALALALTNCVTLGGPLHLSGPQFPQQLATSLLTSLLSPIRSPGRHQVSKWRCKHPKRVRHRLHSRVGDSRPSWWCGRGLGWVSLGALTTLCPGNPQQLDYGPLSTGARPNGLPRPLCPAWRVSWIYFR